VQTSRIPRALPRQQGGGGATTRDRPEPAKFLLVPASPIPCKHWPGSLAIFGVSKKLAGAVRDHYVTLVGLHTDVEDATAIGPQGVGNRRHAPAHEPKQAAFPGVVRAQDNVQVGEFDVAAVKRTISTGIGEADDVHVRNSRFVAAPCDAVAENADPEGLRFIAIPWQQLMGELVLDERTDNWAREKYGLEVQEAT
jgi:hypothetical protein